MTHSYASPPETSGLSPPEGRRLALRKGHAVALFRKRNLSQPAFISLASTESRRRIESRKKRDLRPGFRLSIRSSRNQRGDPARIRQTRCRSSEAPSTRVTHALVFTTGRSNSRRNRDRKAQLYCRRRVARTTAPRHKAIRYAYRGMPRLASPRHLAARPRRDQLIVIVVQADVSPARRGAPASRGVTLTRCEVTLARRGGRRSERSKSEDAEIKMQRRTPPSLSIYIYIYIHTYTQNNRFLRHLSASVRYARSVPLLPPRSPTVSSPFYVACLPARISLNSLPHKRVAGGENARAVFSS